MRTFLLILLVLLTPSCAQLGKLLQTETTTPTVPRVEACDLSDPVALLEAHRFVLAEDGAVWFRLDAACVTKLTELFKAHYGPSPAA